MTKPLYGVYGASGFGREVIPLAREWLMKQDVSLDRLVFIDDGIETAKVMNGYRVLNYAEFLNEHATERYVNIAIANSNIREKIEIRLRLDHVLDWSLQAVNCVIMDEVQIGAGAILSPFVTLTSNICIGKYFHANIYSYVAHDCVIGDFVTLAPSVRCNGNVIIEDHAYIGTGAIIKQGTPQQPLIIGRGAVIGMGAVVTRSVPAGVTVVGNPAKPLIRS
jgi:sugar O-acyltransferase (sialic acid O-acetyltransferase NeuD family)